MEFHGSSPEEVIFFHYTKELSYTLMTEGTVPVPPGRACAQDRDVVPVRDAVRFHKLV
jgi:membrane-bound lytic murein transglycosylase